MQSVALYTSAWIEIMIVGRPRRWIAVALYTSAWIEITNSVTLETIASLVALYTSAWIEIRFCTALSVNPICRTLHECVD